MINAKPESSSSRLHYRLPCFSCPQVLYYMFAIVGMEIFHGLIKFHGYNETKTSDMFCGNIALKGSAFYRNHYCNNNFNDILRSFVLLFELTVVNQWHDILFLTLCSANRDIRCYKLRDLYMCICYIFVSFRFVKTLMYSFYRRNSLICQGQGSVLNCCGIFLLIVI